MNASIYVHPSKQAPVKNNHPWIFPKAILKIVGEPKTGELVDIYCGEDDRFGIGVYNEYSLYRVRVLFLSTEPIANPSLESIIRYRLSQALTLRQCLQLPNPNTTAFRLFNSEGDGLSGLTIDRFNQYCVIASTAYWVEANKALIMGILKQLIPQVEVLWLSQTKSLSQDGWKGPSEEKQERSECVFEESIRFQVNFSNAQKTGLFLDQRDNHKRIAALANGKRVLDLYTYTGGFALHAAKAGATKITAVDSSSQAINTAKENAQLNEIGNIEWIDDDARNYLNLAGEYDIVILDPPKLVPSQRHLNQAKNYYRFLHREVFKAMQPGSLLMTCNCSSALTADVFTHLVYNQALAVGKSVRVLGVYGPSSCHPTLPAFPEGNYLTAVLLGVV